MMEGAPELAGGNGKTTDVGSDVAGELVPPALPAVSWRLMVLPTSSEVSVYDASVAPGIAVQLFPELSQRSHW
jgi:hypothetical protein